MALFDWLLASTSPAAALRRGLKLTEQGDLKQAFPLLTRAARAGIAEAEHRVGRCYLEGAGVPASRTVPIPQKPFYIWGHRELRGRGQCNFGRCAIL